MAFKNYGEAFKQIRLHKNLTLKELEYVSGIPISTLSQFENGNSMLSFDKLDQALDAMYVTLQDYYFVINNGNTQYAISQFNKIKKYFIEKHEDKLCEIHKINIKNGEKGTDLIALCAKLCYSPLTKKEIEKIEKYFTSGLEWSLYDIEMLAYVAGQININLLNNILQELFLTNLFSEYIMELATYREPLIWFLMMSALIFIKNSKQAESDLIITKMEYFSKQIDFTAKFAIYFVKGCYQYKFVSKDMGEKTIKKLCLILADINAQDIKRLMIDYYNNQIKP